MLLTAFTGKTLCFTGNAVFYWQHSPVKRRFTGNIPWSNALLLAALSGQKLCITGNTPWSNTVLLAALPGQNSILLAALPGQPQGTYC